MPFGNGGLNILHSVQATVESGRAALKRFSVHPSFDALVNEGRIKGKELQRLARRQVHVFETQTAKWLARVQRETGIQVGRWQSRLIEAVGVATRPELERLSHRVARLSQTVERVAGRKSRGKRAR